MTTIEKRMQSAFTPEFRRLLATAVDVACSWGVKLVSGHRWDSALPQSNCPEGCLVGVRYPDFLHPKLILLASGLKHHSFQRAFDDGEDNGTSEAALGLWYRAISKRQQRRIMKCHSN